MCFRDSYLALFCSQLATHHCEKNIDSQLYIATHTSRTMQQHVQLQLYHATLKWKLLAMPVTRQLVTMFLHMLHKSSSRSHAHFMRTRIPTNKVHICYTVFGNYSVGSCQKHIQLASLYSLAALLRIISLGSQLVKNWGIAISQEADLHILASWTVSQLQVFEACAMISVW